MRSSFTIAILLAVGATASAQIVPPAGTMDVTIAVQHTHVDGHTDKFGTVAHNIDLRAVSASITAEYSVTDRFALGVSLPYVQSRYRGPSPPPGAVIDDGSMHGSLQDVLLDARYAMIRGDFVVSPFVGFRYPARQYATMGHAAPGRGLQELEMGLSAGHELLALPGFFIGANVSHTIPEAVHNIRVNRTNADLQLGYAVGSRLFVRGFGSWQRSHAGLDLPVPAASEHFHQHDQLARTNHTRAGAGLVFSVADNVNLHVAYSTVVKSVNAHMGRSVSLGTSWTFVPRARMLRRASATPIAFLEQPRLGDAF